MDFETSPIFLLQAPQRRRRHDVWRRRVLPDLPGPDRPDLLARRRRARPLMGDPVPHGRRGLLPLRLEGGPHLGVQLASGPHDRGTHLLQRTR